MSNLNFPKITVILRGYNYEQVNAVMSVLNDSDKKYAVEITLNSPDVFTTITKISKSYGNKFLIGAGTVLNFESAQQAIDAGAQFILSPIKLEKEVLDFCKQKNVLTVPAAMTPSEVYELQSNGADIVKVFPAKTVGSKFFNDIQAPLGKLSLMAVGGVSSTNVNEFLDNGASYVGIASGIFEKQDIENQNIDGLKEALASFENIVY
ncbi:MULTISPECIES: bifunctional 4-hydroxy-2-oxoglutarate aldolase/2-dehydro-3-deoxy-phosphogluconate aldolase [Bacilli]|uniref:bifunctional 4-hydroxy-2-oxoglutarate aldolase/2-dehydro-3-deoxy-phosphogluconate aldolase n=1 Tax=Bacilli TaxID=91061 RepID=UPI0020406E33|nr:bifunctional 4-hydroxy-2-oxoglutarate aldolase/2-dehydro-3-deoxy-phosphogluconate aldolase [Carnobacterium inhibens]MCM3512109.1 bifunctional 4-hydroxy-2-oxoglutarate aldolase/2-dehydro-3-deoxy-phosphogluconate aldolase [Carnobacterium inhibens]